MTSPYLTKSDLDKIRNDIKAMIYKHHSDMKAMNNHITYMRAYTNDHFSAMIAKLTDKSSKTDKQEEELTEISSKLSTYDDHMNKSIIYETQHFDI